MCSLIYALVYSMVLGVSSYRGLCLDYECSGLLYDAVNIKHM
jgi:hypothetical protein